MNRLGIELADKHVLVKERTHTGTSGNPMTRVFLCEEGNGCRPGGMGIKIYGYFLANPAIPKDQMTVIHGQDDIERLASPDEVMLAT